MNSRLFHISTILSVTTGMVVTSNLRELYDLLEYLTGGSVEITNVYDLLEEARYYLSAQYSELSLSNEDLVETISILRDMLESMPAHTNPEVRDNFIAGFVEGIRKNANRSHQLNDMLPVFTGVHLTRELGNRESFPDPAIILAGLNSLFRMVGRDDLTFTINKS